MSGGTIASQAFSPNKLAGLTLWLDASDIGTIIESGGFVSEWNDKSSNNNAVTQVTGSRQPETGIDTINGVNAITFDGIDDFLQRTTFTGGVIIQPNTIFIVWEIPVLPAATRKIIDGGAGANRQIIELNSINIWRMWAGGFANGTLRAINTPYITSSLFNTTSSEGYINGVLDISGDVSTRDLDGITLGARFNITNFLNVKIGEMIIYDRALSTAERLLMETYLSNKWRIALP